MKTYRLALILVGLLTLTAEAADKKAIEININGVGPAVDEAAFKTVKQVIGNAVANGVIDQFTVYGYGDEGGFSACAQASSRSKGFASLVKQLRTIQANPATTAYVLNPVAACANASNTVCTEDAKLCPDGSSVGRVPPSCEFAPCPN